ncbi:uncharacterized protein MYCGRDRAFT_82188, partial [Zymoseptoria tritici IPO323]
MLRVRTRSRNLWRNTMLATRRTQLRISRAMRLLGSHNSSSRRLSKAMAVMTS